MKQRSKRLRRTLLLVLLVLAVLIGDGRLRLTSTEYSLSFDNLPAAFDGFRIVQLSDVHGAVFGEGNERLLQAVAAAEPDLIALTGDLADRDTDLEDTDQLLAGLAEIAPLYYVSGNHEWSEDLLEPLQVLFQRRGVRYLRNEYLTLERADQHIVLAGVEDPNGWRDQLRPDALAEQIRETYPRDFVLLLGHRNDFLEKYPTLPVDLILCGHAHGGVIRIPGVGGLLGTNRELFPDYTAGVYTGETYRLLVSRGLGRMRGIPRIFNNPEVVVLTLRCA